MVRHAFVALALAATGCVPSLPDSGKPAAAVTVTFSDDPKETYAVALRAIVKADLAVEMKDADAGVIQTEWHGSGSYSAGLGVHHRRIRFKVIIESGRCLVKPQIQSRGELGSTVTEWDTYAGNMVDIENDVLERLVLALRSELAPAAAAVSSAAPSNSTPTATATTSADAEAIAVSTMSGVVRFPRGSEVTLLLVTGIEIGGKLVGADGEMVRLEQPGGVIRDLKQAQLKDARLK